MRACPGRGFGRDRDRRAGDAGPPAGRDVASRRGRDDEAAVRPPGCPRRRGRPHRAAAPARRLHPAAARVPRRAAAGRRGWLHRVGQVHPGQLPRRVGRERSRGAASDDALPGPGPPSRRRALVHAGPDPPGPRPRQRRQRRRGSGDHAAGRVVDPAAGARAARRPGHRLRRPRQPRARPSAPRGGRPLALRHDGGPVCGRGALGAAAPGVGARDLGRGGAQPGAPGLDPGDPRAPRLDAQGAGPRSGTDLHRRGVRPRRRRHAAARRGRAAALVAVRPGQGRAGQGLGRPPDADRRPRLAGPAHPGARRRLRGAGRRATGAREGGPGRVRRGDQRGRDGDERRVAAARRGPRAVAGVRRHRRVLPPGRVDGLSRPRPDRGAGSRGSPPRPRTSTRRSTAEWPS